MLDSRIRTRRSAGPLIRDLLEITDPVPPPERVVHIPDARVVVADYGALSLDFPFLRSDAFRRSYAKFACTACASSGRTCTDAIDQWLIEHAALVSVQQTLPNEVNSPIRFSCEKRFAFRPPAYGRALVAPVTGQPEGSAAFLDLKGAGVGPGRVASHAKHASGLEYLGVALADFFYAHLVDKLFSLTVPGYHVVPVYAVIDLGFDMVDGLFGTAPAGLHVRRAHARGINGHAFTGSGSDEERAQLQIEFLLRAFGLTSTNSGSSFDVRRTPEGDQLHFAGKPVACATPADYQRAKELMDIIGEDRFDTINIQLARGATWAPRHAAMVDFGHVNAKRRFPNSLVSLAQDRLLEVGHVIDRGNPLFVQPNPQHALDPDICARSTVSAQGFYLAQAFRSGRLGRRHIENSLRIGLVRAFGRKLLPLASRAA